MKFLRMCFLLLAVFGLTPALAESVDINTADAETLSAALVGVGPQKAAAIVEYREANGPFKSVDDLSAVKGIGEQTVEKNRDRIVVKATKTVAKTVAKPAQ